MTSLLSAVTGTTGETESGQGIEQSRGTSTGDSGGGGSRRRNLALAAVGLGAAYALRRRRAGARAGKRRAASSTTTGELDASKSSDEKRGRSFGGRLTRAAAGIVASVVVRRAIRRWRKR